MVQNFKQFNGTYGCAFCCHEGKVVAKGKGHTKVYPLSAEEPPLRTMAGTIEMAEIVVERNNGQAEMGVKGTSTLLLLPSFDIIKGFVPDYMHSVCLGVVRQFTNIWFDPKYVEEAFHLQPLDLRVIDDEMHNIKPPNEVRGNPRPLSERSFWKVTKWRAFLLLYSPVILKNILQRKFYNHWILHACSLHILLSCVTTEDQLNCAELCLIQFVSQIPELYGIENCFYNSHLLEHLTQSVRDWGLLWANSAFVYESTNGKLLDLFYGTQAVPCQICRNYLHTKELFELMTLYFTMHPEKQACFSID
ncbi:UNVERIFIED_CONTAM: hypothetical protein FKN15_062537 [Acipenser sinensis]